jgi:transposase InsO family protein
VTRLDDRKIAFICRHVVDLKDWTIGQMAAQYGVTKTRVRQLANEYKRTGQIPRLNPSRRPKGPPLKAEEKALIDQAWEEKRFGARLLYQELRRRGHRIPLNKIHKYLRETGRTIPNPKKQKKRKRCRYERDHSFSLAHGDWHRTTENHPYAIVWLDDASRLALAGGEFTENTMDHSLETFQMAELVAREYNSWIREVNTDRGSEFYTSHPDSLSRFQQYLLERGIRYIPSRKSNPQTNGKLERFWYEYDKHRWRYPGMAEFMAWYNDRLHGALWLDLGECPKEAVIRKLQPESLLGFFMRWAY